MPIKINFLANTRDVERSAAKVADAFDDVSDSLNDVARDAKRSGGQIGDAYDDAARDAGRAADRLERDFKLAADATADDYREATARIKAETERLRAETRAPFEAGGESSRAFRDEAVSNLSEVTSSFSGDVTSVVDLVQGTLGGVIADLGPVGLAAGSLAAVGVGLIGAAYQNAQAKQEAFRQRVSDLAGELIDSGRKGAVGVEYIVDQLQELATNTDSADDSLAKLRSTADRSGSSYKDLAQAVAGNTDAIDDQIKKALELQDQWSKTGQGQLEADDALGLSSSNRSKALDEYIQYLRDAKGASDEANKAQKNFADAGGPAMQAAADAASSYADAVQSAYADAGASVDDYYKNGKFNLDQYVADTQTALQTIASYQQNMSEAQVNLAQSGHDQAIQYLEQLGPDAAPLIQAFVDAPKAKQDELAAIWDQLGATSSSSFNSRLQADVGADALTKTIKLAVDRSDWDAVKREVINAGLQTTIQVAAQFTGKSVP